MEQDLLVTQWPKPLKNDGRVQVWVRTAAGDRIAVWVTYYRRKGQRRGGKRYAGLYAGLVLLGIYDRCTPALAAEISLLAAMLGSLDEARDVLANRGVELDIKTVRLIAYRYAARARVEQQIESTALDDTVSGRRVVISTDGGRLRLRETKRGPKTKKGRRRYTGAWREPKVLIIYVVDAEGKREASFAPVIDAILKGPEGMSEDWPPCLPCYAAIWGIRLTRDSWNATIITQNVRVAGPWRSRLQEPEALKLQSVPPYVDTRYLQRLKITQADQVLFIADGAPWIWKRVPLLVQALGLSTEQVHEVLDFYHAAEHLAQVSALRKDWSAKVRSRWRTQQRRLLLGGVVQQVIAAVRDICRGRNSKVASEGQPRSARIGTTSSRIRVAWPMPSSWA